MDRKKASNFTQVELDTIAAEVEKRQAVIYGHLSFGLTAKDKADAWNEIVGVVNSVNTGELRNVKQVRKKWSEVVSGLKRKEAARRREMLKTGGGVSEVGEISSVEERIIGMIEDEAIEGVTGGMDIGLIGEIEEVSLDRKECKVNRKEGKSGSKEGEEERRKKKADESGIDGLYGLEMRRLKVEEERLDVEKERLRVEKRRLEIEEEKLMLKKLHLGVDFVPVEN